MVSKIPEEITCVLNELEHQEIQDRPIRKAEVISIQEIDAKK